MFPAPNDGAECAFGAEHRWRFVKGNESATLGTRQKPLLDEVAKQDSFIPFFDFRAATCPRRTQVAENEGATCPVISLATAKSSP
jgi:hypothetical protein